MENPAPPDQKIPKIDLSKYKKPDMQQYSSGSVQDKYKKKTVNKE